MPKRSFLFPSIPWISAQRIAAGSPLGGAQGLAFSAWLLLSGRCISLLGRALGARESLALAETRTACVGGGLSLGGFGETCFLAGTGVSSSSSSSSYSWGAIV